MRCTYRNIKYVFHETKYKRMNIHNSSPPLLFFLGGGVVCREQIEFPYTITTLVLHFCGYHLKWHEIWEMFIWAFGQDLTRNA